MGRDPRDVSALWDLLYSGARAHSPCVTILEFTRGENPLLHDLVEDPFELRDGHLLAPERPGLGLTLRRDFVRRITV